MEGKRGGGAGRTGGNGGGGICAARFLANRGVDVRLCLTRPGRLGDVPAAQRRIFAAAPGKEISPADLAAHHPDRIIDAAVGYSLSGALRGPEAAVVAWANSSAAPILALDIPSGADATTGETPGAHISAQCTLTLALPKTGMVSPACGKCELADLGIPAGVFVRLGVPYVPPFDDRPSVPLTLT